MNKHFTQNILRFLLLIVIALSSGCGQSIATDSPTLTATLSQTSIATLTPSQINTVESIHPKGILIYSDNNNTYTLNLQNRKTTTIIPNGNKNYPYPVINDNTIYFLQRLQEGTTEQPHQVFKVNLNDTTKEQMTFDNGEKSGLSGLTDGKYLVYVEIGEISSIVLLDKTTNESRTIIQDSKFDFHNPSWSSDGKKIAFFRTTKGQPEGSIAYPLGHLLLYSLDDKSIADPIPEMKTTIDGASWSPDGKNIAISIGNSLKSEICILNVENGTLNQVTEDKFFHGYGSNFKWSPNGDMILFSKFDGQLQIFDLPSKKTTAIPTEQKRIAGIGGLWSPDGDFIAYITSAGEPPSPNPSILNIRNLDTDQNIQFEIPGEGYISFTSWILQ